MNIFSRSVDHWKAALMTLPDTAYFELMRSVFGNIKTPFNKQKLLEDLANFLTKKEIQETISAYINSTDHRIIAAVALLEEPFPAALEKFFAGEFGAAVLHTAVLNLEERLILYRFKDEGQYRLTMNPLLENVLAPFAADTAILFPSKTRERAGEKPAEEARFDDRILAALFAFATGQREFFRNPGEIRKRTLDEGAKLFGPLDIPLLIRAFQCLGLLQTEENYLRPNNQKLSFFASLSPRERLEYLAAGISTCRLEAGEPGEVHFNRLRIQALGRLIHDLGSVLETDRLYPRLTLKRLSAMPKYMEGQALWKTGKEPDWEKEEAFFTTILSAMEETGLLSAPGEDLWALGEISGGQKTGKTGGPVIAMDAAFSCILYPEIDFAGALALASFSMVRETGVTVRFELNRESVVRGFDQGMTAEAMFEHVQRLSGNQGDQNLKFTLKDWEQRYLGVSLHQGLVLTLSEDRRYLAEGPLASLISRTLAPGIYLLPLEDKTAVIRALEKAGIDIIAQPSLGAALFSQPSSAAMGYSPYPSLGSSFHARRAGESKKGSAEKNLKENAKEDAGADISVQIDAAREDAIETAKAHFRKILSGKQLSKADRDELSGRIERRMILQESQLAGASVKYEKMEARGLDYVGKSAIAKQAIASKSLVELAWSVPEGGERRVLCIPETLEKWGEETMLVFTPEEEEYRMEKKGKKEPIRLPLGKISLIRRIKKSIFET